MSKKLLENNQRQQNQNKQINPNLTIKLHNCDIFRTFIKNRNIKGNLKRLKKYLTILRKSNKLRICTTNSLLSMIAILQNWGKICCTKISTFLPTLGEYFFMSETILPRTFIANLSQSIGQTVLLKGFLHKKRALSKNLLFVVLRDKTGIVQIVVEKVEEIAKLEGLQTGTVLSITGKVVAEVKALGGLEIHEPVFEVLVPILEVSPIEIDKDLSHQSENFDTLFDYRVLGLRNIKEQAIFRISSSITDLSRQFLSQNNFLEFRSPKLLAESTEGGAEIFKLKYFDKEATLAQSAQFYKQIMVGVFE